MKRVESYWCGQQHRTGSMITVPPPRVSHTPADRQAAPFQHDQVGFGVLKVELLNHITLHKTVGGGFAMCTGRQVPEDGGWFSIWRGKRATTDSQPVIEQIDAKEATAGIYAAFERRGRQDKAAL